MTQPITNISNHVNPEDCSAEKLVATVAVTKGGLHRLGFFDAYHSKGLEQIDGKEWRIFNVSHRGHYKDKVYVWGMFLEGIGAFNVMVPIERIRNLTENERNVWEGKPMQMFGSHTGTPSYGFEAHLGKDLPL